MPTSNAMLGPGRRSHDTSSVSTLPTQYLPALQYDHTSYRLFKPVFVLSRSTILRLAFKDLDISPGLLAVPVGYSRRQHQST